MEITMGMFMWFYKQCRVYFAIQLGWCVWISLFLLVLVLALRQIFQKRTFLRGMLWGVFLLTPFVGRLELFYEENPIARIFLRWHVFCVQHPVAGDLYLAGMAVSAFLIFRRRVKLARLVGEMEQRPWGGRRIFVNREPATPYAIGALRPKIVILAVMLERLDEEELRTVILHERTHVRLGHLWVYLLWDILRVILWPNIFLSISMKFLKKDMEDICDRAVMQRGGLTSYEYGNVLLKSVKLLRSEQAPESLAAFAGERDYRELRRRFQKVAEHTPYRKGRTALMCVMGGLLLAGALFGIRQASFPKYTEMAGISLVDQKGNYFFLPPSSELDRAFRADGSRIYLNRDAFEEVLRENEIPEQTEGFWIGFDAYMKMPGIGDTPNVIYVDYSGDQPDLEIPYKDGQKTFFACMFKYFV